MTGEKTQQTESAALIDFDEFLVSVPPSQNRTVKDAWRKVSASMGGATKLHLKPLRLHCDNSQCGGIRTFRCSYEPSVKLGAWNNHFIVYVCSNCNSQVKSYSLSIYPHEDEQNNSVCYKYGERPEYGPPVPSRLISLIGPDREIFLKGRQCENHAQGIGAFAYYRRIVENQKGRIIEAILNVAEKISSPPEHVQIIKNAVERLKAAQNDNQFSVAVDSIKDAIPPGLLINGHNPLKLLHSALSEGLHAKNDSECLEAAQSVRVVLAALSERLSQVLSDDRELLEAVRRLSQDKKNKAG